MNALGIDVGGTNARAAVVDPVTGQVVASLREQLAERSPGNVVRVIASLVDRLSAQHVVAAGRIGVGFAGMIRGNVVVNAPNFGWRGVDLGSALRARLGREVQLVNDLSAIAWGELKAGCARGAEDTFTVFVGTGVGSAIVTAGKVLQGATGVAGEFGHTKLVLDGGRPCGCGQRGCLEAYVGGANLEASMREAGIAGRAGELEALAQSGHVEAKRLYDFAVDGLALAVANQVTVLNPAVVVLGGGVLSAAPGMFERVVQVVSRRSSEASTQGLQVLRSTLGDDAGIIGAALLR